MERSVNDVDFFLGISLSKVYFFTFWHKTYSKKYKMHSAAHVVF